MTGRVGSNYSWSAISSPSINREVKEQIPVLTIQLGVSLIVPQEYTEAVKWFRKAAEQGNREAQYNLGIMYYKGEGVPQDYAEAYVWSSLAATSGVKDATENRDIIAEQLTPETLNAAQKRASKLFAEIQSRKE